MQRLNQDIKEGQFQKLYLLYGEEAYLRRQYRDRLKQAIIGDDTMNYHYFEGKDLSVGEIIDLAETMPFFADRRLIVLENTGLFKSGGEQLSEYLTHQPESVFFVFAESEVDKRSRLYKTVQSKGRAVELGIQDENTLKRWILGMIKKEGKNISQPDLEYLLEKTGTDMENIRREMEKLFCYCLSEDTITARAVDAVCTRRISSHIFDMVGAIAEKKQKKALELYYELLALKEPPLRILSLITRQFNLLMQVKALQKKGLSNKVIGEKVGLPGFIAGKYVAQSRNFDREYLREALEACLETEEAVKTGKMNDSMSLELLIVKYSN